MCHDGAGGQPGGVLVSSLTRRNHATIAEYVSVQHGDPLIRPQPRPRGLQIQRFVQRRLDEAFDGLLAPGPERRPAKAAREARDTGKADP